MVKAKKCCCISFIQYFQNFKYPFLAYIQLLKYYLLESIKTRFIIFGISAIIMFCFIFKFSEFLINTEQIPLFFIPELDYDSARYFYSAIAQSLAALLAISFSIFLVFTQIIHKNYSFYQLKTLFSSKISIFTLLFYIITIIFSLYQITKISSIENNLNSIQFFVTNSEITFNENSVVESALFQDIAPVFSTLIFVIICIFCLIFMLYYSLSQIFPKLYIEDLNEKTLKKSKIELKTIKIFKNYRTFLMETFSDYNNLKFEKYLFSINKIIINPLKKSGHVIYVNLRKLSFCSTKLKKVNSSNKIKLNLLNEKIYFLPESTLGLLEIDNSVTDDEKKTIIREIQASIKLSNKFKDLLSNHNYFSALSQFFNKNLFCLDIIELKKIVSEVFSFLRRYILLRKEYNLIPNYNETRELAFSESFFSLFFNTIETLLKSAQNTNIREHLSETLAYQIGKIAKLSIKLYDFQTFIALGSFLKKQDLSFELQHGYQNEPMALRITDEIKTHLLYSDEKEITNMPADVAEIFAEEIKDIYLSIVLDLISNNSEFADTCLETICDLKDNFSSKLMDNLEGSHNDLKFDLDIQFDVFKIGMYIFYKLDNSEKPQIDINLSSRLISVIFEFFRRTGVSEVLNDPKSQYLSIEHWKKQPQSSRAQIMEFHEKNRFLIVLISELKKREFLQLNDVKKEFWLNEKLIPGFEAELQYFLSHNEIWKEILNTDNPYDDFKKTIEWLKEKISEREKGLKDNLANEVLDQSKCDDYILEITEYLKNEPIASQIIKVESCNKEKEECQENIDFSIEIPKEPFVNQELRRPNTASILVYNPFKDVSLNEYRYTLINIINSIDLDSLKVIKELKIQAIEEAIKQISKLNNKATTIITSPTLEYKFKDLEGFDDKNYNRYKNTNCIGFIKEIPIIIEKMNMLPNNCFIIYDKFNYGSLKVQSDYTLNITDNKNTALLTISRLARFDKHLNKGCYIIFKVET